MIQACREGLSAVCEQKGASHAGLVLSRLLTGHADSGQEQGKLKRKVIDAARSASAAGIGVYRMAYERWAEETGNHAWVIVGTRGRLAVGLGNESPLEIGLTLHHTYGMPIIPGSALKGVCRHYCEEIWKRETPSGASGDELSQALFGSTEDGGHITFEDAWMLPESLSSAGTSQGILPDVLTPHHSEYYQDPTNPAKRPSDFDNPIPVPFVSVAGKFRLAVECDLVGDEGKRWADFALKALQKALKRRGVGGKTRAGYGRLEREV